MRRVTGISEGWTLERTGGSSTSSPSLAWPIPAEVPGCVHLDLIREGVIPHPDKGNGETFQAWIGHTEFTWRSTISRELLEEHLGEGRRVDLVFESIDTVASVRQNGVELGTAQNQFHPHRFSFRKRWW